MQFGIVKDKPGDGVLTRIARDKRANTLMLFAFTLIPMIGMIGGGLDLSRLYLVKTRLQHGCDAGALAGRKQMGGGAWTTTGAYSSDALAKRFFDGNFPSNAYGATGTTRSFTESQGDVQGAASAVVPMTLMKVFNNASVTLTVACQAKQQVPNTDIMFVLDNTESMSEDPSGSGHRSAGETPNSTSRIVNLKANVKCFFEAISKLDTGEPSCDPIGGIVSSSRLRFGLVPYATNVNIKELGLPDDHFASAWSYQSRQWASNTWQYKQVSFPLNGFKNSVNEVQLPLGVKGANENFAWDGCVEENTPLTDINAKPVAGLTTSQYAPTMPRAVYYRAQPSGSTTNMASNLNAAQFNSTNNLFSAVAYPYYSCPAKSYRLQTYPEAAGATQFVSRVNAMVHAGNTRHDIGMLWGARLLSPRGIMSASNVAPATGGKLYRHLIFMTDGDVKANECDYATYGVPWFDKREVPSTTTISKTNCGNLGIANTALTNAVYDRTALLCTAIKAEENTILWVISYGGSGIDVTTKTKLMNCATDVNHFFDAIDNAKLKLAFKQIAAQISQLRLTQ